MENKDISSPVAQPSLPWRMASALTTGTIGALCRGFLYGLNRVETIGLERFINVLEERRDVDKRTRGLLTVSNHISVMDDPLIWGVLPLKYQFNPSLHRWSLASYDLCFTNKALSAFFTLGQTLPTHRAAYSPYGGLFQPTITQAIRLLSAQPFAVPTSTSISSSAKPLRTATPSMSPSSPDFIDPFTSSHLTYPLTFTTNGTDAFPAPSAYASRKHSWVHIFPEGRVHQHPHLSMRYFRWGVSRLILESEPCPQIVPMFIDGTQEIMHESRGFPRFVPRVGKRVRVCFGEDVDTESVFGDLRRRWRELVAGQEEALRRQGRGAELGALQMGVLTDGLKYSQEAVELRLEVTRRMRNEVLKVRRSLGYVEEDPKAELVDTWRLEGSKDDRAEGKMKDGSWVKDA